MTAGLSTCYDLRFPELYRAPARRGGQGVRHPGRLAARAGHPLDAARPRAGRREPVRRHRLQHGRDARRHRDGRPLAGRPADRRGAGGRRSRRAGAQCRRRPRRSSTRGAPTSRSWPTGGFPTVRTDARAVRVRAPRARGRRWLNTGGHDLTLAELRGRVVLLDFWTFCCVNCLHVLDELRPVEERFPEELVVIGVHSPKFEHEGDAGRGRGGGRAVCGRPRRPRRPRAGDVAGLHRPRLADPRRRRPRGVHRRLDVRRGARTRARRPRRGARRRAQRPRAPCAAGTPRMRRRPRPPRRSASRARSRSCRTGRSWSPTPHTTRSSSWSRTSRPSGGGGEAPASSTSRRVCSCSRPRPPRRWATTCWWPTRSTIRSRESRCRTTTSASLPDLARRCVAGRPAGPRWTRTSRRRGTWRGGTAGSSWPWPGSTSSGG